MSLLEQGITGMKIWPFDPAAERTNGLDISDAELQAALEAGAWQLPVAPHDCTGPVVLTASTHLSLHAPNALIQETMRAFYTGWYQELVTALPDIRDGTIDAPPGAGLGLELQPGIERRSDAVVRVSRAGDR
jgi:L-alanine-DL-glutamate epimerase-like enolase superfamily enzyme